uniref:Dynein heavy chain 10, axonemal n=2 Tax=Cacopsylla melanoneura TaxID=428564 RepID=A0A8D8V0N2_9HEMI
MRYQEMSSMGIGNKPCLDIRPSADQISDRSISITQLNKTTPKFRNSIAVMPGSDTHSSGGPRTRPHSIISLSSSSGGSSSGSVGGGGPHKTSQCSSAESGIVTDWHTTRSNSSVITIPETGKGSVITHLVYTHESVNGYLVEYMLLLKRHHYITPKHYLIFIENFLDLLNEKLQSYEDQSVRLRKGMAKLTDAQAELILLNQQLDAQKLVVNAKTEACEKLLAEINEAKTRASEQKKKLGEKSKEVEIPLGMEAM